MGLRSGRVLGVAPIPPVPQPPAPPPPPIPPGPVPPGVPALNVLIGLPLHIRQNVLQWVFRGLPRMNLENLNRPRDLGNLCLVNRQLKFEATEAFFTACSFEVTVLTSVECADFMFRVISWGQQAPPGAPPFLYTLEQFRARVRHAQMLSPVGRSLSWGMNSTTRMSVSAFGFMFV
jgi:hypothetical protein